MIVCGHEWSEWEKWLKQAEYVFPDFEIPKEILKKYRILRMDHPDKYINLLFEYFQKLGILLIEYPEQKERVFINRYVINPCDLYQYAYTIYLSTFVKHPGLIELFFSASNMVDSISIQHIINSPFISLDDSPSEDEIFDYLSELPISSAVNILSRMDVEDSVIQSLKKAIISKDTDEFVSLCILNDITFNSIANILLSCWLVKTMKSSLGLFNEAVNGKELGSLDISVSKLNDPEAMRCLNAMSIGEGSLVSYILRQPTELVINQMWRTIYYAIVIGEATKNLCPDPELIERFDNVINRYSLYRHISKTYTIEDIETINNRNFTIPVFEAFRQRYISDLKIPESTGVEKRKAEYYDGNIRTWRVDIMLQLYRMLVAEGLLCWDEKTYYSFMYRMSQSYKPADTTTELYLRPIAWGGKVRELVSLIHHFHDGDSRIWNKGSHFFCDMEGTPIKLGRGCLNQAKSLTPRMDKILNNRLFQ